MQLEDIGLVTAEDLQRVIGLLKATFTHVVLDLSKSYSAIDLVALEMATQILLVTQLDLPCLRNVVRLMMSFSQMDGIAEKVKIVVNRAGLDSGHITLKKAQETIGKPIFWQLPNDYRTMIEARNNGIPLVEFAPKAAITHSMLGLAAALVRRRTTEPAAAAGVKKSPLGKLLNFWPAKAASSACGPRYRRSTRRKRRSRPCAGDEILAAPLRIQLPGRPTDSSVVSPRGITTGITAASGIVELAASIASRRVSATDPFRQTCRICASHLRGKL